MVEERFSASRFWEQVREAKATVVNFIGMMMPVLSKQPESPLDSQNTVRLFYGSPSFDPPFLQAFQERFGTDIIVGFGMTECCYGSIETIGTSRRPNSSGQPRQHPDQRFQNEVAIVDDDGNPRPTGEPGEIVLRNPAVTPATGATRSRPARLCKTAGSTPATWDAWMRTASSTSSTARRT